MLNMKRIINNNEGIALVMTMIVATISLTIMASLIYIVTTATPVSSPMYSRAVECVKGSESIIYEIISSGGAISNTLSANINFTTTISNTCVQNKLNYATSKWDSACDSSLIVDITNSVTYDYSFSDRACQVFIKQVDTVEGNSARSASSSGEKLFRKGVVDMGGAGGGDTEVVHIPYIYTFLAEARSLITTDVKARYYAIIKY